MKQLSNRKNLDTLSLLRGGVYLFLVFMFLLKPVLETVIHSSNDEIEFSELGDEEELELIDVFLDENVKKVNISGDCFALLSQVNQYHNYNENIMISLFLEINTPPPKVA